MAWITKNVGNFASRIAAEANGDTQHATNEAIQHLTQQLEATREELFERHQEWERGKQNYEARLKSLTEGNATAQKVEQLEQKLNRAAEFLKTLNSEKQNLNARIKVLEEEKKEAVEAAETATVATMTTGMDGQISSNGTAANTEENSALERAHYLEAELRAEREQSSTLIQSLKDQLSELIKSNTSLKEQLERQQEESNDHTDISTLLAMAKDELEQARDNVAQLKEVNTKLTDKNNESQPSSPHHQSSSSALEKELADARLTIANLESNLSKESEHVSEIDTMRSSQRELQDALALAREELAQANANHSETQTELSNSKETNAVLTEKEASMTASITELGSQLSTIKLAEEVSARKLIEQFEQEKRVLLASRDQLLQEFQELKNRNQEERLPSTQSDEEINVSDLKEQHEKETTALLASQNSLRQDFDSLQRRYDEDGLRADQLLRERESVIQDLENTVVSKEQTLKTLQEDLQRTTNERNHFQSQHRTLVDRVTNMKSAVGTKLQADMENISTLQKQIDQLTAQNSSYLHTIKQLEDELIASQDHYEKTSRELEHLRRRLVDIQEDASAEVVEKENIIHDLQSRLQREEREREDWETMAAEQRASKDQAVMAMRATERERDAARVERESLRQEFDRQIESLNNLEAVMEAFQSAKESEIQFALEGLQRQLSTANASLEEYQSRAHAAEGQLRQLTLDVEKARQLEREVKEKNVLIGKLRHEAVIQQGHLTEAMRRLKEENSQNTVDIFLNIPRGDQKRFEILQLIAGVLKFTDEQREQAGLIRKAVSGLGALTPTTSGSRSPSMEQIRQYQEPKESFIDMWASFLIRESNANAASNSNNNHSSYSKSPPRQ